MPKKEVEKKDEDCFGFVRFNKETGKYEQGYDPDYEECQDCGDVEECKVATAKNLAKLKGEIEIKKKVEPEKKIPAKKEAKKKVEPKTPYEARSIPVENIAFQDGARKAISEEKLEELKDSIKEQGLLTPILVEPDPKEESKFKGILGSRRFKACQELGFSEILCMVRTERALDDQETLEEQLVENIQRDDLQPLEVQKAYQFLMKKHHYSLEKLSKKVGVSRREVSRVLLLKDLSDKARQTMGKLPISKMATGEIAKRPPEEQEKVIEEIKKGKTAKKLEEERIGKKKSGRPKGTPKQTWTFSGDGFRVTVRFKVGAVEDNRVWGALEQALQSVN